MENVANKQVTSKRDALTERIKGKYPDRDFADDEALYGQINDDYDDYDKQLSGYKEREEQFSNMFSSDPRSAKFLSDWRNGKDPAVELVRQFGTEIKDAIDDPEKLEAIAEANKEFVDRVAKEKELEETYKKNVQESLSMLEEYQQKNSLSDEDVDKAMEWLIGVVKDGVLGKFSTESIDMAMKAINHDADVTDAEQAGEIRGKNTKIEERLRKQQEGDGIPNLDGKNGDGGMQQKKRKSIFDVAQEAR